MENILGVQQVLGTCKCLSLPYMIGRSRKSTFKYVKHIIWKKINSWSNKSLSQVGKKTLIKPVIQSIPTYVMSVFLLPPSLSDEIEKMMNSFWWRHNQNQDKGIHDYLGIVCVGPSIMEDWVSKT